jgi:hypothetical protein
MDYAAIQLVGRTIDFLINTETYGGIQHVLD